MALNDEQVREVIAGEIRALMRQVDAIRADLVLHETGHHGISLPDVVGWSIRQWGQVPPPVKIYILVYALAAIFALVEWFYRRMKALWQQPAQVPMKIWGITP